MPASSSRIFPSAANPRGHAGSSQRRPFHRQPQHQQYCKISPVPPLFGILVLRLLQQKRNRDRQQGINRKPSPPENPERPRRQRIRHTQQHRPGDCARSAWKQSPQSADRRRAKPRRQHWRQQKNRRDHYARPQNVCRIHLLKGSPSRRPSPVGAARSAAASTIAPPTVNFKPHGRVRGREESLQASGHHQHRNHTCHQLCRLNAALRNRLLSSDIRPETASRAQCETPLLPR